ncbi:MAG: YeeE/YedE thiosulfate transporter family protein [bacterium]
MGPLVPDIIGNDLNFIVALIIGILFGAILEQAGFSTSKKLVGLFYGYDFTVLRVFFTAGTVAMIGVLALSHFGYIDMNLVYINPLFLWSAIVGGLIMGLGFVVGGFCPGTSVCAAAIGKIDAMIFIGGAVIGVLFFAEGYPLFEGLFKAADFGSPQIFTTLGMSQSLFAFLLALVAVSAFWAVSIVEDKVNKVKSPKIKITPYYVSLAAIGLFIAVSAFVFNDRKDSLMDKVKDTEFVNSYKFNYITSDELAFRIIDDDKRIQILDFRTNDEFKKFNLPKSTLFTIDNLFEKEPNQILTLRHKLRIIVSNDELSAKKIAIIAGQLGYKNFLVLSGGLEEFKKDIIDFKSPTIVNSKQEADTYRFRTKASVLIPLLIEKNKTSGAVEKKQKRVIGGC